MKRGLRLAALVTAMLLVGLWYRARRVPEPAPAADRSEDAPIIVVAPAPPTPRPASPPTSATPPPSGEVVEAHVTTEALMDRYVEEVCHCPDLACAKEARDRHNRQVGDPPAPGGNRRLHEAFVRASECMNKLSGSGGD